MLKKILMVDDEIDFCFCETESGEGQISSSYRSSTARTALRG